MSAEVGRSFALVPGSVPPGFRFTSWTVEAGSFGYLPRRLQLRFRRGAAVLLWEVAGADAGETADHAACERKGLTHRLNGRAVYGDVYDAYICVTVAARYGSAALAVSVHQEAGDAVGFPELERMVAGAAPPRALPVLPRLVPAADAAALRRAFGADAPLPDRLPPGFVYTRWTIQPANAYGPRTLFVTFGRDGREVVWSYARAGDKYDLECPRGKPPTAAPSSGSRAELDGRTVFYASGAKGQDAWICVTGAHPMRIEVWNDYSVGKTGLMQTAASARS
jgi:hypothetical protein